MYTVTPAQFMQPAQITTMRPAQATVTSAQTTGLDITGLINSILPLFMLMMVMGMLMPMMKGMTSGLSGEK